MAHRFFKHWVFSGTVQLYRILTWIILMAGLVFASTILALRYWILPNVAVYRGEIVQMLSEATGHQITIGDLRGSWDGLRPRLILTEVVMLDQAQQPALELPRVAATLSWQSLIQQRVDFHALDIYQPVLNVRRDTQGAITVGGVLLNMQERHDDGFARWILAQRDIEIHGARVVWEDQSRAAPQLVLENLQFRLMNRGQRHRLGLRAEPPVALSSPVDIRADLEGENLDRLAASLQGKIFVDLAETNIAAWQQWLDFPIHFPRGKGGVRAWLNFDHDHLNGVIADVKLSDVQTRLASHLPQLDLRLLEGRFSWQRSTEGFELTTKQLQLVQGRRAQLPPFDLNLRLSQINSPERISGEIKVSHLEIAPLIELVDHLPLATELRQRLVDLSPSGTVQDMALSWQGTWPQLERYTVRAQVANLALKTQGRMPGFSGLSGHIDGSDKGGIVNLNVTKGNLELPTVFRETLVFSRLAGQLSWINHLGLIELRLNQLNLSNPDFSATVSGQYKTAKEGPGVMDLSAQLNAIAIPRVPAYLPKMMSKDAFAWLSRGLVAGQARDLKFRVKGNLKDFPFAEERQGLFEVSSQIKGGTLEYGPSWPQLTGIEGDFLMSNQKVQVLAKQAYSGRVLLTKIKALIPDALHRDEILQVSGEGEAATSEFLNFITNSPVDRMINGFTESMQAQGRGRLELNLTLPLRNLRNSKVQGQYQWFNNQVLLDSGWPALEQVNGRLEFNESSVRVPQLTAQFLGGPLTMSAGTQTDAAVNVQFQGRINADAVRRAGGLEWLNWARGATDWRGSLVVRNRRADLIVDSTLQGLVIQGPQPFSKVANEILPLHLERRYTGAQQERMTLSLGQWLSAVMLRRTGAAVNALANTTTTATTATAATSPAPAATVDRIAIRVGPGVAPEPERPGLSITGALKSIDVAEWLSWHDQYHLGMSKAGASSNTSSFTLSAVDVRIGELWVADRMLADMGVKLSAQQGGVYLAALRGRDLEGSLTWRSGSAGFTNMAATPNQLVARFRRFNWPAKTPHVQSGAVAESRPVDGVPNLESTSANWPSLDVVVDEMRLGGHPLGRLTLMAKSQQRDWRIERLEMTTPESQFRMDGYWQSWLTRPRVQANVHLEVADVGAWLTRMGFAGGVRRGNAKLNGQLAWLGSPQQLDYPTLSGEFNLEANRGQFEKLDPGIGKLLGVLSLQSLPRRLSLDFRDIFSEGLAFDEISAAVTVNKGIASTDNWKLVGPSARVVMSGQVDLAKETQALRVKVTPQVSDSMAVAGALLAGPVAGVAAYLAQKLLRDPFGQLIAHEFDVSGTWTDPLVAKVERSPATQASP